MAATEDGPLTGVRVVELAGIGPGPFAAMLLADLGADVVRVDRPGAAGLGIDPAHDLTNRNKRSVVIDLKAADGAARVLALVERADILIEGYRPGVAERLGVGPLQCHTRNPELVYGRMTGWGQQGPLAERAGHDIGYIALTGTLGMIGSPEGPPAIPANLVGDYAGGSLYLVAGVLAALHHARTPGGTGQVVDAAIVDGAAHLGTMIHGMMAAGGWQDRRGSNLLDGGCPFYGTYRTSDGAYMAVGALEEQFYTEFTGLLGITDEAPARNDLARWAELRAVITARFRTRTRAEWTAVFDGSDACVAPVLSLREAPEHPHLAARGTFVEHSGMTQPAPAPRFSATPGSVRRGPALPGADTAEVARDWDVPGIAGARQPKAQEACGTSLATASSAGRFVTTPQTPHTLAPAIRKAAVLSTEAFVFEAIRTPRGRGKANGALHGTKPIDLVVGLIQEMRRRFPGLDPAAIDDIVLGVVSPIGDQGSDIARTAAIAAGLPDSVAGVQENRFCASGLEAVNLAAAKIRSGWEDLVLAGGVESMSRVAMGSDGGAWAMDPMTNWDTGFVPQGVGADLIATLEGFTRQDVDSYAALSQERAAEAWKDGRFKRSVVPVRDRNGLVVLDYDEHLRPGTTADSLAALKPSFATIGEMGGFDAVALQKYHWIEKIDHVHHAGNSSGIVDGASLVAIGSGETGERYGLTPRARIVSAAVSGSEPTIMLTGPAPATRKALAKAGLTTGDIDLFEMNEAFAGVVLRFAKDMEVPLDKINVNGGAIAMGHPLGATGAMLLGTLIDELERRDQRYGLVTLCVGGGMGAATVIERL